MKEYHIVKNKFNSFMDMCKSSDAVTEITLQPIKKFDFDAAIIFSDILLVLDAIDIKVEFIYDNSDGSFECDKDEEYCMELMQ